MSFLAPPILSQGDLVRARDISEQNFTQRRKDEGPRAFADMCSTLRPTVEEFMIASDNLRDLTGRVYLDDPDAWQVSRYVSGPPISQEDLWTIVGGPKFKRVPASYADETAEAIRLVIDPVRFPWVGESRGPSREERERAILGTTLLWAAQQVGTGRRREAAERQEAEAAAALAEAGLDFDGSRSKVHFIDDMGRGSYSRERVIAKAKCDVPARLRDGRLFAIECKVSNGPKNGWKRLNREVGGKAADWRNEFGANVVTAVVLAGVFDFSALMSARGQGVVLFWEHDLSPLIDFVENAVSP